MLVVESKDGRNTPRSAPMTLNKCPFCGDEDIRYDDERRCYFCARCDAEGPKDIHGIPEAWNRRIEN